MASIGRRIISFFGRIRAFITKEDSKKDSIPYTIDEDTNVQLVGYRYLSGNVTDIDCQDGNSLDFSTNDKLSSCPRKDGTPGAKCENQGEEAPESVGDNIKIEVFHANMDWTIVDGMEDNIFPRHVKKPGIGTNGGPATGKQQTVAEFLLNNGYCQVPPKSAHVESFQLLRHVGKHRFKKVKHDVLLEIGDEHKFLVHREKFLFHAGHFQESLIDKERTSNTFWTLKADPEYVDPTALFYIFQFLYENRPLTCRHFEKVITAANYLGIDRMISKLQLIVYSSMPISLNSRMQNSLLAFVLAFELRSQLEKSRVIMTLDSDNVPVIVKGQKGDLTEEDLSRLVAFKSERYMVSLTDIKGNAFAKVAVGPHVVFDAAESLTYWVFNVFKSNVEEAIFIDAEMWKSCLGTSLKQSVEYLSLHYQEFILSNAYKQLNAAQFEYIPRQEIAEDLEYIPNQHQVPEWIKMSFWTKNLKLESESEE